jgi:hypothetical protein
MKYTVWIAMPNAADESWRCLFEGASGIAHALRRLGHDVTFNSGTDPYAADGGRLIVFNAHRLQVSRLPDDAIVFNAEQVRAMAAQNPLWNSYVELMKSHVTWDYSATNGEQLAKGGVSRLVHCPVGYWPGLSNVVPTATTSVDEDLDVLFIGSLNDRRIKILKRVAGRRLKTHVVFGVHSAERDRLIARAKVVLNIHFYTDPIWEIFRCSHLLANRKCVVTENGGIDPQLEALASKTCAYVAYDKIPETCEALVRDTPRRREIAERGYQAFAEHDQLSYVRTALEAS